MSQVLAFNKWDCSQIVVEDPGLQRYITIAPRIVPKTGSRYARFRFRKSESFIVERLINRMMVIGHKGKKHFISSGHNTGKSGKAFQTVRDAFVMVEERLKKNPVEVLVKAIENGAPREEIITIEYGGARYPKPVEVAPQRRVDIALKYIAQGAGQKAFNSKRSAASCLAEELINAYKRSAQSAAVAKKFEVERQSDSSR